MTRSRGVRTPRAGSLLLSVLCLFTFGCAERSGDSDGVGGLGGLGGTDSSGGVAGSDSMAGSGGTPEGELKPTACAGEPALFVVSARDHAFGSGQDVGQDHFPELVLGPPHGAGKTSGSTDHVVSLGDGGFVELAFGDYAIVDGAGPDFIVFENAFFIGGDSALPYAEFGQVSVSQDGAEWTSFPCQTEDLPYDSCAGWHPVLANPDTNDLDPTDPDVAGGDSFDLAELGLPWARYVRIDDVVDDKELTFDLDAVAVVHPGCF